MKHALCPTVTHTEVHHSASLPVTDFSLVCPLLSSLDICCVSRCHALGPPLKGADATREVLERCPYAVRRFLRFCSAFFVLDFFVRLGPRDFCPFDCFACESLARAIAASADRHFLPE